MITEPSLRHQNGLKNQLKRRLSYYFIVEGIHRELGIFFRILAEKKKTLSLGEIRKQNYAHNK